MLTLLLLLFTGLVKLDVFEASAAANGDGEVVLGVIGRFEEGCWCGCFVDELEPDDELELEDVEPLEGLGGGNIWLC